MRKIILLLAILITFTASVYFGYNTASRTIIVPTPTQAPTPTITPSATQQNLLYIQIDDSNSSQPTLEAVWMVVYFKSPNQTLLTFNQFYPSEKYPQFASLEKTFSLQPTGEPSTQFLREISTTNVQWDGYLLMDEAGAGQIHNWLRNLGIPGPTQIEPSTQKLLETVCGYLDLKETITPAQPPKFDWHQFDVHFQTDLALDTLLAGWDGLFDGSGPIRCEIGSE